MGFNGIGTKTLFVLIIFPWAFLVAASADTDSDIQFSYGNGSTGPLHWGNLSSDWWFCGSGHSQSPIKIRSKTLQRLERNSLRRNYKGGSADLKLDHYSVAVEWTNNGGSIYWDKVEYKLVEFHVHAPSEHTIDGERFPLEAHIVHEDPNGNILVIGILYKYGKENDFIAQAFRDVSTLVANGENEHHIENISMGAVKFEDKYYHYFGSLTTPPCTEGVKWVIMRKKQRVSHEQVNMILDAQSGETARPEQPLNGRVVYKHG